jgi:hypothetical protein
MEMEGYRPPNRKPGGIPWCKQELSILQDMHESLKPLWPVIKIFLIAEFTIF